MSRAPRLTVVLCTHNPDPERLAEVLSSLAPQLTIGHRELILVDNASTPPLTRGDLAAAERHGRILREDRVGLANARSSGARAARAKLLVFVDDDNVLAPDYLNIAEAISISRPDLGVFAGRAIGRFEVQPGWLHRPHLPCYAVRDLGTAPIEGAGGSLSQWEPFGAGMVVRADVAAAFTQLNDTFENGFPLGRSANKVLSGEDSLFSCIANKLGYVVAYRPELWLEHLIPRSRLTARYLFKLVEAQGRTEAFINAACGRLSAAPKPAQFSLFLIRRFLSRLRAPGLHEALTHIFWDIGYYDERATLSDGRALRLAKGLAQLEKGPAP